jgi:hypothetical protein
VAVSPARASTPEFSSCPAPPTRSRRDQGRPGIFSFGRGVPSRWDLLSRGSHFPTIQSEFQSCTGGLPAPLFPRAGTQRAPSRTSSRVTSFSFHLSPPPPRHASRGGRRCGRYPAPVLLHGGAGLLAPMSLPPPVPRTGGHFGVTPLEERTQFQRRIGAHPFSSV